MSKATTLFILAILLCFTLSCTSRPDPFTPEKTQYKGDEVVDEKCEGVGEEECLMRRTLVAHVDYIYTQKQKP
ncbi:hypothetical protein LguiA_017681 [Lonicera macranthoides]